MSAKKSSVQGESVQGIYLIDTCILCEILEIPGKSNKEESAECIAEFDQRATAGWRFVLPLATLIETGNHIAQGGDGRKRRQLAKQFVEFVQASMDSKSPFLNTKIWDADIKAWLVGFPDNAMCGIGLGDASIQADKEKVKSTCGISGLVVEIWTKDKHHVCRQGK